LIFGTYQSLGGEAVGSVQSGTVPNAGQRSIDRLVAREVDGTQIAPLEAANRPMGDSYSGQIMPNIRTFLILVNLKTLVVAALAVAATAACRHFGITAAFPLTLIAIAIVFPIVFSIGGAYKRREAALDDYGSLKAHGRAIYFAARDWLEHSDPATLAEARDLLKGLLETCRTLFTQPRAHMMENEEAVYRAFSHLSDFIKSLRKKGLASGEVSRCNQYLSKMMVAFESVKHIYQYRTPVTLRAYSDIFIVLLPIAYGPYFATVAVDQNPFVSYVLPVLFTLILVSLDNIQAHLEDPFDQIGEDDVNINAEKFASQLDGLTVRADR
jgi:predicted membrane chloride channel (bestrophin family)